MNEHKEPTYEDLRKQLSDEEIADSFVFRSSMSAEEREKAEEEFRKLRLERLGSMSDEQILLSELIKMKLLMEDYFERVEFAESYSFPEQLGAYISLTQKSQADFADDLGISKARLGHILAGEEHPDIALMYRLEYHSDGIIPATYWYRLHAKQVERSMSVDKENRTREYEQVKKPLSLPSSI